MNTKVIFNVDKKIKDKAMQVAKAQGVTISGYLSMSLADYAQGKKKIEIVEIPNAKTRKILDSAMKNIKSGKNLSPSFTSSKDALEWLHSR